MKKPTILEGIGPAAVAGIATRLDHDWPDQGLGPVFTELAVRPERMPLADVRRLDIAIQALPDEE